MIDLAGRTAFITGGAQGIGLGIARALAGRGVRVALADVDAAALETAREALPAGAAVAAHVLDIRDRAAFAEVADAVEAELGPVTLLFNNAGVAGRVLVEHMSYASWDWVMDINLGGVINGLQTFVPRMLQRGDGGHIVNTSSGAGLIDGGTGFLYHGSKFAVVGISESLRSELAPHGIGVSVLCPGAVATGIVGNTTGLAPEGVERHDPRLEAWRDALAGGVSDGISPDAVGTIVVEGIEADRAPWIFTDDIMGPLISARTAALLDAIPSA